MPSSREGESHTALCETFGFQGQKERTEHRLTHFDSDQLLLADSYPHDLTMVVLSRVKLNGVPIMAYMGNKPD